MHRWLILVSLGTGLCAGCARPSTNAPSQLPPAVRTPDPVPVLVPPTQAAPASTLAKAEPKAPSKAPVSAPEDPEAAPELSQQQIEERLLAGTLGCLSVGKPNAGKLVNGVQLTRNDYFDPVDPNSAWGTDETLSYLEAAARKVHEAFPGSPRLWVGDISSKRGGRLSPHRSHQSGRDVDIGYFYDKPGPWYRRATPANLDLPRTWAFVRALVTETDVEMIFIDRTLSSALWRYAEGIGEDATWLRRVFATSPGEQPLVRHARGHATHMHVRFRNPRAERLAQRAYPVLVKHELVDKVEVYRYHRVRRGETLGKLAKRYGTTVRAIQRANGLRTNVIQAKQSYKIPTGAAAGSIGTVSPVPPRRLPPSEPPLRPSAAGTAPLTPTQSTTTPPMPASP